jgi:hypothetical protein
MIYADELSLYIYQSIVDQLAGNLIPRICSERYQRIL